MKFKIGDKVKYVRKPDNTTGWKVEKVGVGFITELGGRDHTYDYELKSKPTISSEYIGLFNEEELTKGGIMFEVGQEVIDEDGYKRKVLAVTCLLTALSDTDYYDRFDDWYTDEELEAGGFKEVSDEEVEVSMDDIADKFGIDVEKLKIKKED